MAHGYASVHTYYKTCTDCGANLDPQEQCDCHKQFDDSSIRHSVGAAAHHRDLLAEYRWKLTASDSPPNTVSTYMEAIKRLNTYLLRKHGIDLRSEQGMLAVTADHLRGYYDSVVVEGRKRSTRNLYAVAIRAFFQFHYEQETCKTNPALVLPYVKARYGSGETKADEEQFYTTETIQSVLAYLCGGITKKSRQRDVALFALLLASAMRINEACSLNISDMDTIREGFVHVIGKGGEKQRVTIAGFAVPLLDAYLSKRNAAGREAPLFLSQKGGRLTENAAWKAFARFQKPLGIQTGTHICRHTAITYIAHKAGAATARDAARHKQITITNRYIHRLDDQVASAVNATPIADTFEGANATAS